MIMEKEAISWNCTGGEIEMLQSWDSGLCVQLAEDVKLPYFLPILFHIIL